MIDSGTRAGADYMDRGFRVDYRVMSKDMTIVLTTDDYEKAERRAQQIGGTIHGSRELVEKVRRGGKKEDSKSSQETYR